MQAFFLVVGGALIIYLLFTLFLTYLVQQVPRKPVEDKPDWGKVTDIKIPAIDGRRLEVWHIEPDSPSRGIVVLAHGWGRNRDRMIGRAKYFARWGFTTVIHSARDHGQSSPKRFMNAMKFSEDIDAVLNWIKEPVILYGHSAGAAAAVISATHNQNQVKVLFLEACYAYTEEALLYLYRWFNPFFGNFFGPMILFWMNLFYRNRLDVVSPARLAPSIEIPVMLIHGEKDRRFPLQFALNLKNSFSSEEVELYIGEGAGHSDSSLTPGYKGAVQKFVDRHWPCTA